MSKTNLKKLWEKRYLTRVNKAVTQITQQSQHKSWQYIRNTPKAEVIPPPKQTNGVTLLVIEIGCKQPLHGKHHEHRTQTRIFNPNLVYWEVRLEFRYDPASEPTRSTFVMCKALTTNCCLKQSMSSKSQYLETERLSSSRLIGDGG